MRKRLLFPLVLSIAANTAAQQLGETIEVRVTNVDVVVTDRAGHPIHGLTRDDFELYENRKLQPITNFYEIRGDAPAPDTASAQPGSAPAAVVPAEMRQRSIVVFIDNVSIDPFRRNQAIDAISKALDTLLRPEDDAMIVGWTRRSEVLQPFTTDRAALKRVLDKARDLTGTASTITFQKQQVISEASAMLAAARAGRMRMADAYSSSLGAARAYAEWLRQTEQLLLRSVTQTVSTLSGGEGKKVMIFVGGELEQNPGLDVFQMVDSLFAGAIRNPSPPIIREGDLSVTDDLQKLARNANANGVTMYMIDALDRTRDATYGSLQNLPDPEVEFTQQSNSYQSMALLASDTGGGVHSGSRNFSLALDNISRDLGSYYSLGYKPPEAGGVDRSITVKVKRAGAAVRSRRGYAMKTADQQMEDRVVANVFHATLRSDFPIKVEVAPPEPFEKGFFKVKVTVTFPGDLTYLRDGDNLTGEYAVFFVTAAEDGSLSQIGRQIQPMKFPAAAADELKRKAFTHTTTLVVRPGSQWISVALVDRVGARIGYGRAAINAR